MGGDKLGFAENFLLSGVAAAVSKLPPHPLKESNSWFKIKEKC
jgi:hypothetical protein